MATILSDDIHIMYMAKGAEKYVWMFRESQKKQALRSLGVFASEDELSFSWHDAAVLAQRVRKEVRT